MKDYRAFDLRGAIDKIQRPVIEDARLRAEAMEAKSQKEAKDRANNYRQTEILEALLEDSRNAIEQRNAIIRFMVESVVASDQSKETKMKTLLEYSVQFATLAGGANDLMDIISGAMEKLN